MGPENVKLTIPYLKDVEAGREIRRKHIPNDGLTVLGRRIDAVRTVLTGIKFQIVMNDSGDNDDNEVAILG